MKKILLPGMMAALAFAACTNEDIVSQKTAEAPEADLSNRPVVGMVDLDFGPQTRATLVDGSFGLIEWESGKDQIGARIIDNLTGSACAGGHAEHKYTVADYAWSNYRYDLGTDGKWTSGALMVEGNYMFYAPYNEKALYRTPLEIVFPTEQSVGKLTPVAEDAKYNSNTDAVERFYESREYTIAVGHTFVSATDENAGVKVSPRMTQLYAYPQITLVNDYTIDVEVEGEDGEKTTEKKPADLKIDQITVFSDKIYKSGKIKHAGLVDALKLDLDKRTHTDDEGKEVIDCGGATYENWTEEDLTKDQKTAWFLKNARTSDITTWEATSTKVNGEDVSNDGQIVITLDEPVTIPAGQKVSLNVVLPAEDYGEENLSVNVRVLAVDEEGEEVEMMFENTSSFGYEGDNQLVDGLGYAVAKRYPMQEYNFPANDAAPYVKTTAGALATFRLSGKLVPYVEKQQPAQPTEGIHNNNEFVEWLNGILDNSTPKEEGEHFQLASDHEVVFNAELMAAVEEYLNDSKATVSFTSDLEVVGGTAENPLVIDAAKYPSFGKLTVTSGVVTLKGVTDDDGSVIENLTVKEVAVENNAVVDYNGVTTKASSITGNVSNATLTGETVNVADGVTLNNVTITGAANFAGNNTLTETTITGDVVFNGNTTINSLVAEDAWVRGGVVEVKGATAMTNAYVMPWSSGKLVISNSDYAPEKIELGYKDGQSGILDINADWTPKNITTAEANENKTVSNVINIAAGKEVDLSGLNWTNATLNNNGTITSALTVPAGSVYNQATENAAVTGAITNDGTINAWGVIAVATNNGEIVAKANTDEITVNAGSGKINNTELAVVYDESTTQTVYYDKNDISTARIAEIMAVKDARINKIFVTNKWTVEANWSAPKNTDETESALKTIEFKGNGELLYINAAEVNFSDVNVIINGKVSWRGRSMESSAVKSLKATYTQNSTLSTSKIDMTGAYADVLTDGGTITLTDDLVLEEALVVTGKVIVNLNGKNITAGLFQENDGEINDGTSDSYAFWVKQGGKLTINGNGIVQTQACTYSMAVWAQGGSVTINGGTYKNAGEGADLIYASDGGSVTINAGSFEAVARITEGWNGTQDLHPTLNVKGNTDSSIIVNGGTFKNFNPANNCAETNADGGTSFLAEGATVQGVAADGYQFKDSTKDPYNDYIKGKYGDVTYTVTAPAAAN